LGHNDTRLYFGLPKNGRVEQVEVTWPDGGVTRIADLPSNRLLVVCQNDGYAVRDLRETDPTEVK
jgi:hypothetical protein